MWSSSCHLRPGEIDRAAGGIRLLRGVGGGERGPHLRGGDDRIGAVQHIDEMAHLVVERAQRRDRDRVRGVAVKVDLALRRVMQGALFAENGNASQEIATLV